MQKKWQIFWSGIRLDFKLFLFIWLLLNVYRALSLGLMHGYMQADADAADVAAALFYGARISLKTAGLFMAASALLITLPQSLLQARRGDGFRRGLGGAAAFLLSALFMAKFPYYAEFHTGFNQLVFNTFQDDIGAIVQTFISGYQLIPRLLAAAALAALLHWLLGLFLRLRLPLPEMPAGGRKKAVFCAALCMGLAVFSVFVRFGGSLGYANSLHWENSSKTGDAFLNEMILDDVQALYRGYSVKRRIEKGTASGVEQGKLRAYLEATAGEKLSAKTADDYLRRTAAGARIAPPRHIFIILGESFAQWPLLDDFSNLHIGDGVRGIAQKPDSAWLKAFLPNGAFTPMAVNALICGLSDVNIYPNQQPESYSGVYRTALAPQLKALGYRTCFWYAGFSAWERIRDFALAQGFDEFHSASDLPYDSGNVWGCDDEYLFAAIKDKALEESAPAVHVILTVSNHAPYSVDLEKAGFDAAAVKKALPPTERDNEDLLRRLGHYWYTDRMIASFVDDVEAKYPSDSLFIITGDHGERTNIGKNPTMFERSAVPLIVHGAGISPELFPPGTAGGHVNITPTLIELIAPRGFVYYALGASLTGESKAGFNQSRWITAGSMGSIEKGMEETLKAGCRVAEDRAAALEEVRRMRTISWWRTMKGNQLE